MTIKHISFDVWNTLILPNPEYAKARDRFLSETFDLPVDTVVRAYREIKDGADKMAEARGDGMLNPVVYTRFINLLTLGDHRMNSRGREQAWDTRRGVPFWKEVRYGLEAAFHRHPPIIVPEVRDTLQAIHDIPRDISLSIGSNTNFIRGKILSEAVLNYLCDWDFKVFSDELGKAKPAPHFFETIIDATGTVAPYEILHVGDNKICDGHCEFSGLKFHYVAGPHELPSVLERIKG